MKIIKFDLPINGAKVKNLEELCDNLTDEILLLARSGQLERWLRTRQLPDQAQAVAEVVKREGTDKGLFLALCKVLDVAAHPDDVRAIFDAPPVPGRFISGARYAELYEQVKQQLSEIKKEIEENNKSKTNLDVLESRRRKALEEAQSVRALMMEKDKFLYSRG